MMYKHKQYGIIWKMLNKERTKFQLINRGTKFKRTEIGKIVTQTPSEAEEWDNTDEWLIVDEFNEYLKLL